MDDDRFWMPAVSFPRPGEANMAPKLEPENPVAMGAVLVGLVEEILAQRRAAKSADVAEDLTGI